MSRWTSRKLWAAIIGAGVVFVNSYFGWNFSTEEVLVFLLPIVAYIFGEAWVDKSREQ